MPLISLRFSDIDRVYACVTLGMLSIVANLSCADVCRYVLKTRAQPSHSQLAIYCFSRHFVFARRGSMHCKAYLFQVFNQRICKRWCCGRVSPSYSQRRRPCVHRAYAAPVRPARPAKSATPRCARIPAASNARTRRSGTARVCWFDNRRAVHARCKARTVTRVITAGSAQCRLRVPPLASRPTLLISCCNALSGSALRSSGAPAICTGLQASKETTNRFWRDGNENTKGRLCKQRVADH